VNIKQLETFVAIVRQGSFAAAAARLNATQSTVSARIQELEEILGVPVFDRTQRKAQLTAKGRELLEYAENAVALFSEIRHKVGAAEALSGVVRVGVAELVAVSWLPDLVAVLHRDYPDLRLELDVSLTVELFAKVSWSGDLDLALIPGSEFDSSLAAHSLGRVQFVWMASPSLGLPDRTLTPEDFAGRSVLSLGEHSYHYETTRHWLGATPGRRPRVDTCNSMSVIASLTASGLGISLLPPDCYRAEIASGRLRILDTRPAVPEVEFSAVYSKRRLQTIPRLVAELAKGVSTFRRTPG
jgi:DNA-binding transcriptional LysR family regulator